jgi:hypothetical protein
MLIALVSSLKCFLAMELKNMNRQRKHKSFIIYLMIMINLLLVVGLIIYLSHFTTTEEKLRADKNIIAINGPWKFRIGDSKQYALPDYDDSSWESINLAAPPGIHDDDVGLSGFVPGWTAKGHPGYSGYAWYRLKIQLDTLSATNWSLVSSPAVDEAYQLFVDGQLLGNAGDFSGIDPIAYSIQPRIFTLPKSLKADNEITVAFRVWMSADALTTGAGGIHIAPALGETTHIYKQYKFQWEQTIKGYIVEVVLPVMFLLLAITIYSVHNNIKKTSSYLWFIIALALVSLLRLNQAIYFWFQIESSREATIISSVIIRPLALGSWLMAWWKWFDLSQPKWLPKLIAILTLLFMGFQLLGLSWISETTHPQFQTIAGYVRLLLLALMLFILWNAIRKKGAKELLVFFAMLLVTIALYPQEVSTLNIIPGIWFPYGVGVSRGQFFYSLFVFLMYIVLIKQERNVGDDDPYHYQAVH